MVAVGRMKGIAAGLRRSAANRRVGTQPVLGDFTSELLATLRRHEAHTSVRRTSVRQANRRNEGRRDACFLLPPASVTLADLVAPPAPLPLPMPLLAAELLDLEPELGCADPTDPLPMPAVELLDLEPELGCVTPWTHYPPTRHPNPPRLGDWGALRAREGRLAPRPRQGCYTPRYAHNARPHANPMSVPSPSLRWRVCLCGLLCGLAFLLRLRLCW